MSEGENLLGERLEGLSWTFAKTMPTIPHYHSHHSKNNDGKKRILECAAGISTFGVDRKWRGRPSKKYFFYNGWMYWFMDKHWGNVVLINRQETTQDNLGQLSE